MNRIEKYIVPWDFSDHSKVALRYALQHFHGQAIKVICVLERPNPHDIGFSWGEDYEKKALSQCQNDFFEQAGIPTETGVQFEVAFGEPADEICRFAGQNGANYIVMSTHGRTGIQKLMMGSIAQKVIAKANHPVILLPAKWAERQSPVGSTAIASIVEAAK